LVRGCLIFSDGRKGQSLSTAGTVGIASTSAESNAIRSGLFPCFVDYSLAAMVGCTTIAAAATQ